MAYRYLGSATTNANGVAELNFTGTGRGELDIVASTSNPISGSSLVSGTYEVLDCLVYDDGVTDPKPTGAWIKSGSGTVTIDTTGTTVIASSNTTYRNTTLLTGDFEFMLQATIDGGSIRIGVQCPSTQNYAQSKASFNEGENLYIKFKRVGTTYTAQYSIDGVNWTNRNLETNNASDNDVYFIISVETSGTERTITYKDLKIYPI